MKAVKTKKEVSSLLLSYRQEIERFGVKRIGLFGSFVKGKQQKRNGVDLFVYSGKEKFQKFHLSCLFS